MKIHLFRNMCPVLLSEMVKSQLWWRSNSALELHLFSDHYELLGNLSWQLTMREGVWNSQFGVGVLAVARADTTKLLVRSYVSQSHAELLKSETLTKEILWINKANLRNSWEKHSSIDLLWKCLLRIFSTEKLFSTLKYWQRNKHSFC